jgi:hypothetical protein
MVSNMKRLTFAGFCNYCRVQSFVCLGVVVAGCAWWWILGGKHWTEAHLSFWRAQLVFFTLVIVPSLWQAPFMIGLNVWGRRRFKAWEKRLQADLAAWDREHGL